MAHAFCSPQRYFEVGLNLSENVKEQSKKVEYLNNTWGESSKDADQSFVGLVLNYSDKSKASLKSAPLSFYQLQVSFLNFKKRVEESK